jgi:hypothetical protein
MLTVPHQKITNIVTARPGKENVFSDSPRFSWRGQVWLVFPSEDGVPGGGVTQGI